MSCTNYILNGRLSPVSSSTDLNFTAQIPNCSHPYFPNLSPLFPPSMQLSTSTSFFLLLYSTAAFAQEFRWNATTAGDWAIVGGGMASYMKCIDGGYPMSGT